MDESKLDAIYKKSREVFDTYAGATSSNGLAPGQALQWELQAWEKRNFGWQPDHCAVLGIVEELGELHESQNDSQFSDAIADACIFAMQYATRKRLDFWTIVGFADENYGYSAMIVAGRIAHVQLKTEQGIRGMGDVEASRRSALFALLEIVGYLKFKYSNDSHELFDLVSSTAQEVLKRDWRKK